MQHPNSSSRYYAAEATPLQAEGWWDFADSAFAFPGPQSHPAPQFPVGDRPSYVPDIDMDPRFCFPSQADSKMPLMASPTFSPVQLETGLNPDPHCTDESSSYWMDPQSYDQPPQWPISRDRESQDVWDALIASFAISDASSPYPTYGEFPSGSAFLPRLLPRPSSGSPSDDSSSGRLSPFSVFTSSACSSRRSSVDSAFSASDSVDSNCNTTSLTTKCCSHCAATATPLWRRNPATQQPLCNACGLYLQQRNKMRPCALIAADDDGGDDAGNGAEGGPECSHCHTHRTSVWRRSKTGARLCNACGVYARLRGRDRPLTLKRNKIKPRCKHAPK
ncbi:hypothetical protein C8R43DRAFT_1239008 [Mycena crocata]|nr:hypothetical protein C8R43DRAFT_1239008 [Mycena crocata]